MRRRITVLAMSMLLLAAATGFFMAAAGPNDYSVTATAIEACSCPLFCSCYYNTEPTGGHMCQFNMAHKFEPGSHWGSVDLGGAKLWISGDLGDHFGDGKTEWAKITFDEDTTEAQREAIQGWLGKMFPVEWNKVEVAVDSISWENGAKTAHAALADGSASIDLEKVFDGHGKQAVAMNTVYWGANRNDGFLLAHSKHHFDGEPAFEFEGRNGFTVTTTLEGTIE